MQVRSGWMTGIAFAPAFSYETRRAAAEQGSRGPPDTPFLKQERSSACLTAVRCKRCAAAAPRLARCAATSCPAGSIILSHEQRESLDGVLAQRASRGG